MPGLKVNKDAMPFLSSNAQDFIEDTSTVSNGVNNVIFLSSNAQDFIEDTLQEMEH